MDSVTKRITAIVDTRYGGNWAAAARAAGLRRTTVQKLKDGADPHVSTVQTLADAWGVPVAWLVGADGVAEDPAGYVAPPPHDPLDRYRALTRLVLAEVASMGPAADLARAEALIAWLADGPPLPPERARSLVRLCLAACDEGAPTAQS